MMSGVLMIPGALRGIIAAVVVMVVSAGVARAQVDTSFALLVSGAVGFGVNVSQEILLPREADNRGPNATFRVQWKPDHRLRVGLETGLMRFTSAAGVVRDSSGVTDPRSIYLDGVPLLITFSMNFDRLTINAGAGYYLMLSSLRGEGAVTFSSQLDYGIAFSAEYLFPVTERLGLGGGAGMYGATQLGQYLAVVQLRAQYRLVDF